MKFSKYGQVGVLLCAAAILIAFTNRPEENFEMRFKTFLTAKTDSLLSSVALLSKAVGEKPINIELAQQRLAACRRAYKEEEAAITYFFPGEAFRLNRAVVPSIEEDDEISALVPYAGFQYVETLLYGDSVQSKRKELNRLVDDIYALIQNMPAAIAQLNFEERAVWEAMQLELIRQGMLGLTEFETAESKQGRQETIAVMKGFSDCISFCYPEVSPAQQKSITDFKTLTCAGSDYLKLNKDNYFDFYQQHYNAISGQLLRCRDELVLVNNEYQTTAVNLHLRSIFDPHAFNSYFFVPGKRIVDKEKVAELGRILFFDPALSANNLRACASCHQADKAFTDGLALSQSFEPGRSLTRNAPTLVNSVLQRKLFHDGRAFTFEDQAGRVMSNPLEMHNDFSAVADKLIMSSEYRKLFKEAFMDTDDTTITSRSILLAIAEYERTLIGMNSRFDKAISGRSPELNYDEIAGFNIFVGKGQCASCHFLPLFNGLVPPTYVETEWESVGTPAAGAQAVKNLDPDLGRYEIIPVDIFKHSFKVPTMRNVALTGPYMHNGVFKTLEEVIEFYDRGGGNGLGYEVPNQTLSEEPLHLTPNEKFQLKAFLESLTDTTNLTRKPETLPMFEGNPLLNARTLGGNY